MMFFYRLLLGRRERTQPFLYKKYREIFIYILLFSIHNFIYIIYCHILEQPRGVIANNAAMTDFGFYFFGLRTYLWDGCFRDSKRGLDQIFF